MNRLIEGIYRCLNFISEWPGILTIMAMAATIVAGVLSRYLFNYPLHWVEEYNGYGFVIVVLLPLSFVLRRATHLRMDLIVRSIPQRAAYYLGIITTLIALAFVILLLIGTTEMAVESIISGKKAWSMQATPIGPVQLIIPIGLSLFAIEIIATLVRSIKTGFVPTEGTRGEAPINRGF